MNTLINRGILPGILNELMTSGVNFNINRNSACTSWPRIDIVENDESYSLKAELPGMDRKDVNIVVEKGVLRIEGEKKEETKRENGKYYHFEREYGKFSRSFALPDGTDAAQIQAKMSNGVLELTITKAEKEKPKTIEVKIE